MRTYLTTRLESPADNAYALPQPSRAEHNPYPETYADVLRLMLLYRCLTAVESEGANNLILHFGRVTITVKLERRADGIRIDGLLRTVLLKRRVTAAESIDADTLVLRFGHMSLTLHLEPRPDAIRIDGAVDSVFSMAAPYPM